AGWACISLTLTTATEPVRSAFLWVPYPTTTTSSNEEMSSIRTTSITVLLPATMRWDSNPMKENTKVDPSGTDKLYLPSILVAVPVVVPSTDTVTPGKGSPFWSVTVPVITCSIAEKTLEGGISLGDAFEAIDRKSVG